MRGIVCVERLSKMIVGAQCLRLALVVHDDRNRREKQTGVSCLDRQILPDAGNYAIFAMNLRRLVLSLFYYSMRFSLASLPSLQRQFYVFYYFLTTYKLLGFL